MNITNLKKGEIKEILNSKSIPKINLTTGIVKKVDGINGKYILKPEDYKGAGGAKQYRRDYVEEWFDFNFEEYFEIAKTHHKRASKFKKNPAYKPKKILNALPSFPLVKMQTIWDRRIDDYLLGKVPLKEKRASSKMYMAIPEWLTEEALERDRWNDVNSFAAGIPLTPKSRPAIESMLELIKTHKDDFFYYLAKYDRLTDWTWDNNHFWNSVNNLDFKGAGASEMLMVMLFKGASMMGGTKSYDIKIINDYYPDGVTIELKSDVSSYGSFRISKSSIASFEVFDRVNDLCIGIMKTFNNASHKEIQSHLTTEEFLALKRMVVNNEQLSLYNQWRTITEFNESRLRQLQIFLYYFNDVTSRTNFFKMFDTHTYVRHPEYLFKDLHNAVDIYFDNHEIDHFIFVRNQEILHLNLQDISFAEITSGDVKIIENDRARKRSHYDENIAFEMWLSDKSKTFAETYNHIQEN